VSSRRRTVELDPASGIRSERVWWLWRDRVPLRGLVVLAGEKGLAKSILSNAWLAAQLTRGELDGELSGGLVDVLVASAEDDWNAVIKPRLMAHGASLDHVHRVRARDAEGNEALLTLPDDAPLIEAEVERLRDEGRAVGLLVVDPIGAFVSERTDSHRDAPVRRALAPLSALAERLEIAVLVIAHLTKDETKKLLSRVSGAAAFVNPARSVLVLARDPDDADGEQGRERVLVHVASNWGRYAPSLVCRIESRLVDVDDGSRADVGYLVMKGESAVSVDDLQSGGDENATEAEEAIGRALADGRKQRCEDRDRGRARVLEAHGRAGGEAHGAAHAAGVEDRVGRLPSHDDVGSLPAATVATRTPLTRCVSLLALQRGGISHSKAVLVVATVVATIRSVATVATVATVLYGLSRLRGLRRGRNVARSSLPSRRSGSNAEQANTPSNGRLLTAEEAARLLAVPVSWVRRESKAGRLPHVKLGRYYRYSEPSLRAFIAAAERGPVPYRKYAAPGSQPGGSPHG
jgi:excisionase family DNA binding protein